MSKVATLATLSPRAFAPDVEVLEDDALVVLEMLNWAAAYRPVQHVSVCAAVAGYSALSALALGIELPTTSGWVERLRFLITVDAEAQTIELGARMYLAAANTAQVRITVGGAAASTLTTFTNATNGTEHTATVATSSSGTGELEVIVELNHTTGSASGCYLRDLRIGEGEITPASLPDPEDS